MFSVRSIVTVCLLLLVNYTKQDPIDEEICKDLGEGKRFILSIGVINTRFIALVGKSNWENNPDNIYVYDQLAEKSVNTSGCCEHQAPKITLTGGVLLSAKWATLHSRLKGKTITNKTIIISDSQFVYVLAVVTDPDPIEVLYNIDQDKLDTYPLKWYFGAFEHVETLDTYMNPAFMSTDKNATFYYYYAAIFMDGSLNPPYVFFHAFGGYTFDSNTIHDQDASVSALSGGRFSMCRSSKGSYYSKIEHYCATDDAPNWNVDTGFTSGQYVFMFDHGQLKLIITTGDITFEKGSGMWNYDIVLSAYLYKDVFVPGQSPKKNDSNNNQNDTRAVAESGSPIGIIIGVIIALIVLLGVTAVGVYFCCFKDKVGAGAAPKGRRSTKGHGSSSKGHGSSSKGGKIKMKGHGTSSKGGGTSSKGHGASSKGRTTSAKGFGASSKGLTTSAKGRATSAKGYGASSKGRTTSAKGRATSAKGYGTSSKGKTSKRLTSSRKGGKTSSRKGTSKGTSAPGMISRKLTSKRAKSTKRSSMPKMSRTVKRNIARSVKATVAHKT